MNHIPQRVIRQIFILLVILIMAGLIFMELVPYLSGVLGAITFYVLLRKPMLFLTKKGWKPHWAALFLCIASFVGILLPVTGVLLMLGNKISSVASNSSRVASALKNQVTAWEQQFGLDLGDKIDVGGITGWISNNLQSVAGGTFDAFIAIGLMYFLLYYLFTDSKLSKNAIGDYLPVNRHNLKVISDEISIMVRSNALGIPLVALAQGVVALIGFLIFGVEDPFFWFVITTIGSMIPFVGTLVGIVPVFILEMSTGNTFGAWAVLIYGFVVVGSTDNLFRLYVLKKLDNVHPLITLVGVIVGVPLFGFIGLIFGPLLISLFLVLLSIYKKEFPAQNP